MDNPDKFSPLVRLNKDIVAQEIARMKLRFPGHVTSSTVGKSVVGLLVAFFLTGFFGLFFVGNETS